VIDHREAGGAEVVATEFTKAVRGIDGMHVSETVFPGTLTLLLCFPGMGSVAWRRSACTPPTFIAVTTWLRDLADVSLLKTAVSGGVFICLTSFSLSCKELPK